MRKCKFRVGDIVVGHMSAYQRRIHNGERYGITQHGTYWVVTEHIENGWQYAGDIDDMYIMHTIPGIHTGSFGVDSKYFRKGTQEGLRRYKLKIMREHDERLRKEKEARALEYRMRPFDIPEEE